MGQPSGIFWAKSAEIAWIPSKVAPGVDIKKLGKADGRAMQLVRFQAGAEFPSHVHTGPEFIYVLEGEAIQNGQRLEAGSVSVGATGSRDERFRSDSGCLLLLIYDL